MRVPGICAALLWVLSPAAGQDLPGGPELAKKVVDLRRTSSARARGRMALTGAGRQQKVYQISILQKQVAGSVNLLWSVTDPPEARLRILAEIPTRGEAGVRMAAAGHAAAVVPQKRWSEPILGSHLTIEDLVEDYFTWPVQAVTGEEPAGGRTCYVVRSGPGSRQSSYASIVTWLDGTTLVPMRIVKEPRGGGAAKEIECRGLRQSHGRWVASTIEIRRKGSVGSTRITFTGGSEAAKVKDSELDPALVFRSGGARK